MPVPPVIRDDCPCPNTACRRHTLCDACEEFRAGQGKVPFCREQKLPATDRAGTVPGRG